MADADQTNARDVMARLEVMLAHALHKKIDGL